MTITKDITAITGAGIVHHVAAMALQDGRPLTVVVGHHEIKEQWRRHVPEGVAVLRVSEWLKRAHDPEGTLIVCDCMSREAYARALETLKRVEAEVWTIRAWPGSHPFASPLDNPVK